MSEITPISNNNKIKDNNESNSMSYHDLINYCSIRKQLSRIIPNFYQNIHQNKTITQDFEQYNKIKEEIKGTINNWLKISKTKKIRTNRRIKKFNEKSRNTEDYY